MKPDLKPKAENRRSFLRRTINQYHQIALKLAPDPTWTLGTAGLVYTYEGEVLWSIMAGLCVGWILKKSKP